MIWTVKHITVKGFAKVQVNASRMLSTVYVDGAEMVELFIPYVLRLWDAPLLEDMETRGFIFIQQAEQGTHDKIALFCKLYEEAKGVKYKVSGADSGKIKGISVNEALLKFYLDDKRASGSVGWLWRTKQSIGNLVRYYNEVRAAMVAPDASKWPNSYDREFEKKLDGAGITAYRLHLKSLGLVPKADRTGQIIDWVPKSNG